MSNNVLDKLFQLYCIHLVLISDPTLKESGPSIFFYNIYVNAKPKLHMVHTTFKFTSTAHKLSVIYRMKLLRIEKSKTPGKRFDAIFLLDNNRTKTTHFGDSSMEDYTQHHDKERRERYRTRNHKDLNIGDPTRAGYLSYYILWGDSTSLQSNIYKYKQLFNL